MTRHEGTVRIALAFAAFLASLSGVIWRQSRALDGLRDLESIRSRRAAVESDKSRLTERIQYLESRTRITDVAGRRWGMRVPQSDEEFVILLSPSERRDAVPGRSRVARGAVLANVASTSQERD
jgi:cell division protein FtsL